jgi:uncharacterized phage infection (PIP) family protein YhgE
LLNAAVAKETSERSKGLVKAADECGKLRAELEGQIKAHGATVTEIRDKINTVKTEAKADLDTVEKDFNEKISSCTGSLESAKTELTKKVDAKVDALEEKIQGLKKGADDLEEDIGKTLTQVKDGAELALSAAKGALLEALEKHKAESLKALQTAKTELTKEWEEAEDRTTAAREAQEGSRAGEEDNTKVPASWVESLSLEEQQKIRHQGRITWGAAVWEYPDKIAAWLLSRRIGTITKRHLKKGSEALKGIGVTVGLDNDTIGILWSKLNPEGDDL